MKTLLSIISLFVGLSAFSQSSSLFIDSLKISLVIPTVDDTIQLIAYTRHPTTGSGKYDRKVFMTDTVVNVYSCWTSGPFQETEYVNDTFKLNPMNAGNYKIRFLYKSLRPWELDSLEPCLTNPYYDSAFLNFTVIEPNGVTNLGNRRMFSVFPNPANHFLNVQLTEKLTENTSFQILSTTGQLVMQNAITQQPNFTIDVSTLPAGLYFLQLSDGRQRVVKKFVKE